MLQKNIDNDCVQMVWMYVTEEMGIGMYVPKFDLEHQTSWPCLMIKSLVYTLLFNVKIQ